MICGKEGRDRLLLAVAWLVLIGAGLSHVLWAQANTASKWRLELTATAPATIYQRGEAVVLTVSIVNKSGETVYIDRTKPYIRVTDVNGLVISGEPADEPPEAPAHYYIQRGNKQIFTVPVTRLGGGQAVSETIADALERYHVHITDGIYRLKTILTVAFYEEKDLIAREDFPGQLWVEAKADLPQLTLESNTVEIEIRRPRPLALYVMITSAVGIVIAGLILLLKHKAHSREKSRTT